MALNELKASQMSQDWYTTLRSIQKRIPKEPFGSVMLDQTNIPTSIKQGAIFTADEMNHFIKALVSTKSNEFLGHANWKSYEPGEVTKGNVPLTTLQTNINKLLDEMETINGLYSFNGDDYTTANSTVTGNGHDGTNVVCPENKLCEPNCTDDGEHTTNGDNATYTQDVRDMPCEQDGHDAANPNDGTHSVMSEDYVYCDCSDDGNNNDDACCECAYHDVNGDFGDMTDQVTDGNYSDWGETACSEYGDEELEIEPGHGYCAYENAELCPYYGLDGVLSADAGGGCSVQDPVLDCCNCHTDSANADDGTYEANGDDTIYNQTGDGHCVDNDVQAAEGEADGCSEYDYTSDTTCAENTDNRVCVNYETQETCSEDGLYNVGPN